MGADSEVIVGGYALNTKSLMTVAPVVLIS